MTIFRSSNLGNAILLAVGALFSIHCTLATVREYRAGRALGGKFGDHDRTTSPAGFWTIMAGNGLAVLMGIAFVICGVLGLMGYLNS
jgi:hypothetical protein